MRLTIAGWDAFYSERRAHKRTRSAYDRLVLTHQRTLVDLRREEQRAADLALAVTEPCPMCEELERERNNALLEADTAKAELDEVRAALHWLERDFKVS